jgi:2-oxoisovalerate dehydrogenase E2 component (dihydrolipoyl transacylase)
MTSFHLPDLGEGLAEAIIRQWHIKEGQEIAIDTIMLTVETAKAIVDIPAPIYGKVSAIHIAQDETVKVGTKLVTFVSESSTVVGNIETDELTLAEENLEFSLSNISEKYPSINPMAHVMEQANKSVVSATLCEEAILTNWHEKQDVTARIIQAMTFAIKLSPNINSHFDDITKKLIVKNDINIALAVQNNNNLFFPIIENCNEFQSPFNIRSKIKEIKENPSIYSSKNATIFLSNIGTIAGTFATPVVIPPCVAILATGTIKEKVVPINGKITIAKVMPLSVSFDHRAITGADVANFLYHLITDLELSRSNTTICQVTS